MTPLLTALSSFLLAVARAVVAASLSPAATASRTRRTCVLSSVLTALLRSRAFSLVPMRLIWDLMFATYGLSCICLLYTSDAADDLLCVDLGGRRIIKKKKKEHFATNLI